MKLILCSEGFYTDEIVATCEKLVGKSRKMINIAVINEAYAVDHDDNLRWVLENLNTVAKNFGGQLELVNLLALDLETVTTRLRQHDVILVVGGHTDYLMSVFNKTGFSKVLPDLLRKKVYVGSSAGSMVMGRRLSDSVYEKIYSQHETYGVGRYLELVDFTIMPHLDSPHFLNRKEILTEAVRDDSCMIYSLRDDGAIVVQNDKIEIIGSKPLMLHSKK